MYVLAQYPIFISGLATEPGTASGLDANHYPYMSCLMVSTGRQVRGEVCLRHEKEIHLVVRQIYLNVVKAVLGLFTLPPHPSPLVPPTPHPSALEKLSFLSLWLSSLDKNKNCGK